MHNRDKRSNDEDFPATSTKSTSFKEISMSHKNLKKKFENCAASGGMIVELKILQHIKKTVLKTPTECCKILRETEHNLKPIENLM